VLFIFFGLGQYLVYQTRVQFKINSKMTSLLTSPVLGN